jgi:hypothetical protein
VSPGRARPVEIYGDSADTPGGVLDEHRSRDTGDANVEVTIEVVRDRRGLAESLAGRRIWAAVAAGAVAVALGALSLLVLTSSTGGPSTRARLATEVPAATTVHERGAAARFGIRSHCVRQAIVSPDGTFARVDYDQGTGCGTANNHVTLILRRVRGSWVPRFAAFLWRCPSNVLPRRVQAELHLCAR